MTYASKYARAHLRWNPFGTVDAPTWASLAVPLIDIAELSRWLSSEPQRAVEFVGDCGRGKTTHLLALFHSCRDEGRPTTGFHKLQPDEKPRIAGPMGTEILFVDESQLLRPKRRQRLFGQAKAVALGTHESHRDELASAGFECRSVNVHRSDLGHLERIVETRYRWARLPTGVPPRPSREDLLALHERFGDDLRSIEHALYESVQGQIERLNVDGKM